jgi:hypothetical protein
MTQKVDFRNKVVYGFKVLGWLAHDNNYWDRTCPSCKGMYSSFQTANCPKCGQPLTFITKGDGVPMSISEGTFYPALTKGQKAKDMKAIENRKNGLVPKYRFKMFNFGGNGVITPHPLHNRMVKGALVEITLINHQIIPSWFTGENNVPHVEMMIMVFDNYGDKIEVLADGKAADAITPHRVNPDGTPAPMNLDTQTAASTVTETAPNPKLATLEAMKAQIDAMMAEIKGESAQAPAPNPDPAPTTAPAPAPTQSFNPFEDEVTDNDVFANAM